MSITAEVAGGEPATRPPTVEERPLHFVWLEITGKCNLRCVHCYADSSPAGDHGRVRTARWLSLLREAAELGAGDVQLIGGEPTLHPDFETLVLAARAHGLRVEVYSNLVHVHERAWELFRDAGVSLATSFYAADAVTHGLVTGRAESHRRTLRNIERAVELGLPLRVGMIDVLPEQDLVSAESLLRKVGVTNVGHDHARRIGRAESCGAREPAQVEDVDRSEQLCGQCTRGRLAIDPDGQVHPCVFSRWLTVGNVLDESLAAIAGSPELAAIREALEREFASRGERAEALAAAAGSKPRKPKAGKPRRKKGTPDQSKPEERLCTPLTLCRPDVFCAPKGCLPACAPFHPPTTRPAQQGAPARR